jgi:hypothetical protein
MDISKRLKNFLYFKQIKVSNFESQIGFSNGYVNSITRSIGNHKLAKIVERFPELNIEWLLVGKGSMLKSSAPDSAVVNEPETPYNYTVSKLDQAQEKIIALQEKLIEARDKFLEKDKELFDVKNNFIALQKMVLELKTENDALKNEHKNKKPYISV